MSAAASRLKGKTIVITGASAGIGRSTAIDFARTCPTDIKLVLAARRIDTLRDLAHQIETDYGDGVKICPARLDVSNPQEVKGFVNSLPEEFRDIDVLVNNAGVAFGGMHRSPDIGLGHIEAMFATNVYGLINLTQSIMPIFLKRDEGGRGDIIIGSIAGTDPYPGGSIYCATKAALRALTVALRKELIATRIRVMEIDPGQVATEFTMIRFGGDKAKPDAVYAGVEPMTPDDVADIIVFAATRENVVLADILRCFRAIRPAR